MEIIKEILMWSHLFIALILLIYCLVKLRGCGGEFIASYFGVVIIIELSWISIGLFGIDILTLSMIHFFLKALYLILFTIGVSKILKVIHKKQEDFKEKYTNHSDYTLFLGIFFSIVSIVFLIFLLIVDIRTHGNIHFQTFTSPLINLFLLIYCLINLRDYGGKFIATSFGILVIITLGQKIEFLYFIFNEETEIISDISLYINFFMNLIYAIFFITGISKILKLIDVKQENLGKMSFQQILFSFTGRINRKTFWGVFFSMIAVSIAVMLILSGFLRNDQTRDILYFLYLIPLAWVSLAMQIKRWHDRNKSGWMVLISFIPIVGSLWTLGELGFCRGTIDTNQYGEVPLSN